MEPETITDRRGRPLRDLRISLTDYCTMRCLYCMPQELFTHHQFLGSHELLDFSQIVQVAQAAASLGVRKIKLTGGEPLTRGLVWDLVDRLKKTLPEVEIGLITNALHLKPLVHRLKDAGLDRITVSLDALDPGVFSTMTGNGHRVETVLEAIEAAAQAGFRPLKVNMVVIRGKNDQEILPLAEYFRRPGFQLRFIEYMDAGCVNRWDPSQVVSSAEILETLTAHWSLVPQPVGPYGETASRYRYSDIPAEVGFISPVSQPFCGSCVRSRLGADGKLYTCLYSRQGVDLKPALADPDPEVLEKKLRQAWLGREDRYSEIRGSVLQAPRVRPEMFAIGG